MQHKWICRVVDLEIFVRGPELFIFDSNRWLVYHDESSFAFPPCKKPSSAIKDSAFIQFGWTCWTLHAPKSIHPFHEPGLGWREITVVETVNPSAFARPPTCFKAYLAWMFSLPKFPDPSTWPWWLSIWLWWLEDFFFFELKGYLGNKENEGKMKVECRWLLHFCFKLLALAMTSASIVLFWSAIFPILKKKSRVSKRMQLLARTTRAASLAFLSQCFAGKSKPSITQELIFCLKHIIFNPLHRLKSGGCPSISLPLICKTEVVSGTPNSPVFNPIIWVPLDGSPAKVVGRCKRGSFPPEAHGWTNRCILCLAPAFSLFLIMWPFLMLKAERLIERFEVHVLMQFFAHSKATTIHIHTHISFDYKIYHFDFFLLPCLKSDSHRQDYAFHRPLRPKYELSDEEISPCWRVWSLLVFIGYNPLPWEPHNLNFWRLWPKS